MARKKKTWTEKLADAKAKMPEAHKFYCEKSKQHMVVPAVEEIEGLMRRVRKGRLTTMKQMTDLLRERHNVDMCCPMTTGIFAWIIAHAADEAEQAGRKRIVPWWRTLKTGGELNPKYPGKGEIQQRRLEEEGHQVTQKGKKLVVADFEGALIGPRKASSGSKARPKPDLVRKVLVRDDFGLCVLLPKTAWSMLPPEGPARVKVDGTTRRVTVQSEQCDCQGKGIHEHRFLSLPKSARLKQGDRVAIAYL